MITKQAVFYRVFIVLVLLVVCPNLTGQAIAALPARPNLSTLSKTLTPGRAIATWPAGVPAAEKRPVLVFLPGWAGAGAVNASVSAQNIGLVNEGYVTLAIGFDDLGGWTSNIDASAAEGLGKLCADASIPANCAAIVLVGESYGAAQNYWVIEYLRASGFDGGIGSTGKTLGFLSQDSGYGAPGFITNPATGAFTRTGLANTAAYSVAMIENLGDTTFPVDECTWGNCGVRLLSNAHRARADKTVLSICPPAGEHGTRGFADWEAWVISAIKTIIHVNNAIPTFSSYTPPTLTVSNACGNTNIQPGLSVSGINIVANGQPVRLHGVNMGDPFWARNPAWYPMYSTADYATLAQAWHANVVRISVFPTQWKNMNHVTLLAGLAQEVNAALDNGMYVIISYHVIGWPDGWYQPAYPGNPADTYDSSMSVATTFWAQMAQTYGSDSRIIFDLWNEPAHDSSDWVGANPNPYWPVLKGFYENLIQTVRTNGAQNIVLATGNRWASWLVGIKEFPLADANVVYAYHKYSVNGSNTAAEWNKDTGGLIGVKPVIVSEWGYEDNDVTNPTWPGSQSSYGDPFTSWLDQNNLGNLAWMYHHDWTPALLKADGSLTLYGSFVKKYISSQSSPPPNTGTGASTAGVFRPANGLLYLRNSNTTGFADIAINYGLPGDYPVTGDWDGNGTDTIGIYRNGRFYLRNSNTIGVADLVFPFGAAGDQPIAGDWNGDGIDTIGVYRSSSGTFYLRNSNNAGPADGFFSLGNPRDVGIAGDWNGDGTDTVGVFRPGNGALYLKNANTTGIADITINYGLPGDQPVTGDWDNNGTDTIGVFRGGRFYLRNSNTIGFADTTLVLGFPSDMPISGNWDGLP